MARYTISDKAARDLAELWDYIEAQSGSEIAADRFIDGLLESFSALADFPDMGKPRDYLPEGVLAFPHERYMIFYLKTNEGIAIAHVLYGGRDFMAFFSATD